MYLKLLTKAIFVLVFALYIYIYISHDRTKSLCKFKPKECPFLPVLLVAVNLTLVGQFGTQQH